MHVANSGLRQIASDFLTSENRVGDAQNSPDEHAECDFIERLYGQRAVANRARCDGERLRTACCYQHVGDAIAVGVAGRYAGPKTKPDTEGVALSAHGVIMGRHAM